jgi:hypothetical protein
MMRKVVTSSLFVLLSLVAITTPGSADQISACVDGNVQWMIEHFYDDGMYEIRATSGHVGIGLAIDEQDVPWVVKHFRVNDAASLAGKTFTSECFIRENGRIRYVDPNFVLGMIAAREKNVRQNLPPSKN